MEHGWSSREKLKIKSDYQRFTQGFTGRCISFPSLSFFPSSRLGFRNFAQVFKFNSISSDTILGFFSELNYIGYLNSRKLLEPVLMGIIRSCFSFIAGTVCGIYVAQNYQVPNITKLIDTTLHKAKQVEETYRKPKKKGSDDDNYD
ncbi:hypothetical protein AHAS_Ahas13G0199700 [Arachis hypogaea]